MGGWGQFIWLAAIVIGRLGGGILLGALALIGLVRVQSKFIR